MSRYSYDSSWQAFDVIVAELDLCNEKGEKKKGLFLLHYLQAAWS